MIIRFWSNSCKYNYFDCFSSSDIFGSSKCWHIYNVLVKKPVIAIALYYVVLLLLGSVLSPNEFTKNSIGYTPFGIDDTQLLSDFEIMNVIEPISTGVFYFNVHFFIDIIISKL